MNLTEYKEKKLQEMDPKFAKAYAISHAELELELEIRNAIINIRKKHHLSKKELCKLTGISKTDMHKFENSGRTPSIKQLQKIAQATNCQLKISFVPKEKIKE